MAACFVSLSAFSFPAMLTWLGIMPSLHSYYPELTFVTIGWSLFTLLIA